MHAKLQNFNDFYLTTREPPGAEIPSGVYPTVVHPDADPTANVLVVQDYKLGKYLGRLDVTFDDEGNVIGWGGNPILMDKDIEEGKSLKLVFPDWVPIFNGVTCNIFTGISTIFTILHCS